MRETRSFWHFKHTYAGVREEGRVQPRLADSAGCVCAQVPCRPPGNVQIRVTAATGSYLRLVLLQV